MKSKTSNKKTPHKTRKKLKIYHNKPVKPILKLIYPYNRYTNKQRKNLTRKSTRHVTAIVIITWGIAFMEKNVSSYTMSPQKSMYSFQTARRTTFATQRN